MPVFMRSAAALITQILSTSGSASLEVSKTLQDGRGCTPKCSDISPTIDTSNNDVYSKMLYKLFFHIPCAVRFLVVEFCHLIHKIVHSFLLVIVFLKIFCNLQECLLPRFISWPAFLLSFASVSLTRKRYLLPRPKIGTANLVIPAAMRSWEKDILPCTFSSQPSLQSSQIRLNVV